MKIASNSHSALYKKEDKQKGFSPGEARTHNPGITQQRTVYKYRALTDCATGEFEKSRPLARFFKLGCKIA